MTDTNVEKIYFDLAEEKEPETKRFGGSNNCAYNHAVVNDVIQACWKPAKKDEPSEAHEIWEERAQKVAIHGLAGIRPQTELEGMLAAQIVAAHAATMECYRRAAISEQTFEARQMNLNQAAKASRTFIALNESLLKVRGQSGKQTVQVHHHHHSQDNRTQIAAEQAVVNVTPEGGKQESETQPHERAHEPASIEHVSAETVDVSAFMRSKEPAG